MKMLQKAGFVRQNRYHATDLEGRECTIIEFTIRGTRFGVRTGELRKALKGAFAARVEPITQDWKQHLMGVAGAASLSKTGKAINITLNSGDRFTVPVQALKTVISNPRIYATVSAIPGQNTPKTYSAYNGRRVLITELPG